MKVEIRNPITSELTEAFDLDVYPRFNGPQSRIHGPIFANGRSYMLIDGNVHVYRDFSEDLALAFELWNGG